MPFKIIATRRRGKAELCTVPFNWENKGILRWPKHNADVLSKDDSVKPGSDWLTMECSLKRKYFNTYHEAEVELTSMLDKTDTDETDAEKSASTHDHRHRSNNTIESPDYNAIAQTLVDPGKTMENTTPRLAPENDVIYQIINNSSNNIDNTQHTSGTLDQVLEQLNNVQVFQTIIINNQETMMKKIAELSVQLEEVQKQQNSSNLTLLSQAKGMETKMFSIKPIANIEELSLFEKQLSSPEAFRNLQEKYSILCSKQIGTGTSCGYRLLDALFEKAFLCKCSWTGGSRNNADVKIGFKAYKNVIQFFFCLVNSWDTTFTVQDNEAFLKCVLRNALKRKEMKNIRMSGQKKRAKISGADKVIIHTDNNNEQRQEGEEPDEENFSLC